MLLEGGGIDWFVVSKIIIFLLYVVAGILINADMS